MTDEIPRPPLGQMVIDMVVTYQHANVDCDGEVEEIIGIEHGEMRVRFRCVECGTCPVVRV